MKNNIQRDDIVVFEFKTPRYGVVRAFKGTVIGTTDFGTIMVSFPEAYCFGSQTGTMYVPYTSVIAKADVGGSVYQIGKWFRGKCVISSEYTGQIPVASCCA